MPPTRTRTASRLAVFAAVAGLATVALATALASPSKASRPGNPTRVSDYPLTIVVFVTQPKRPKAGQLFTAGIGIVDEDTGEPLDWGEVHCPATIRGRNVHVVRRKFIESSGVALCVWKIPARTGGQRLYAHIDVDADYASVEKSFSRTIRP